MHHYCYSKEVIMKEMGTVTWKIWHLYKSYSYFNQSSWLIFLQIWNLDLENAFVKVV